VRPLLERWREARGIAADPLRAYLDSGEAEARAQARREGVPAGWA
jgi:L-rhamnose isomerase / sugar isomerase